MAGAVHGSAQSGVLALYVQAPKQEGDRRRIRGALCHLPRQTLQAMYEEATAERFGLMYVNMLAPTKRDMFFKGFDYRMTPSVSFVITNAQDPPRYRRILPQRRHASWKSWHACR